MRDRYTLRAEDNLRDRPRWEVIDTEEPDADRRVVATVIWTRADVPEIAARVCDAFNNKLRE